MRGLRRQDGAFGRLAYDCAICGRKDIPVSKLQLRAAGSLGSSGTAIEGSVFTVSPARCAMRFTTEEAAVKHGTHERRKTAALSAKGELEEPFSAPTFGRTATAPVFATDRINGDADLIMARINYRFGGFGGYGAPVAARY